MRRLWKLYPLQPSANTPHRRGRRPPTQICGSGIPGSIAFEFGGPGPHREYYVPTDCELTIIKQTYPDYDPLCPPWHLIQADLIRNEELASSTSLTSPALVALVAATKLADGSDAPGIKTASDVVARLRDEWATYHQLSEFTALSEGAIRGKVRRLLNDPDSGFADADKQAIHDARPGTARTRIRIRAVWRHLVGHLR